MNETVSERVFYFSHRPVIRQDAETTKIRIVYGASAKNVKSLLPWTNVWKKDHSYKIDCGMYWYVLDLELYYFVVR